MIDKGDEHEGISKKFLDWLTGVGAIATLLATIFGLFLDEKNAKLYAFGAALLLAIVSGAVYFYQRQRAAKLKIADALEPLSGSATLRGLLPFEEGDQLPGRARDAQALYTLVASSTFRFGVLWGESGCGKTSLLRAGLVPKLKNDKLLPIYIKKPTNNPQEVIRAELLKATPLLGKPTNKSLNQLIKSAAPKGKKIILLFDQFEEFFLTNRTPKLRSSFIKWLGEVIADDNVPVAFLLGIRADFFAQLQNFAPQIPEPTSIRTTYQLQNFDTEQAKQIFSAAAKADGIPFEVELIQAVISELETEEFIRPAELQVVGTRLKRKNIYTLNRYDALGGARGILSSYISDEIKQSPNEQTARLVLRLMCADAVETKSPNDLSKEDILRNISGGEGVLPTSVDSPKDVQAILNQFEAARVLIHTDEDKYNLVHDYLAPYVRTATEGTETNTERANRMLKRYVAEYKDDKRTRIPFRYLLWIKKYASPELKTTGKTSELLLNSTRSIYFTTARLVSILLVFILISNLLLSNLYFLSDQSGNINVIAPNPTSFFSKNNISVYKLYDSLTVMQTDFGDSDLDPEAALQSGALLSTGFWFWKTKNGYQAWGDVLGRQLNPTAKAQALRWLDQPLQAREILLSTILSTSSLKFSERASALHALGIFAQIYPEYISDDTLKRLVDYLITPTPDGPSSDNFSDISSDLSALARARPEAVTTEMLNQLFNIITSPVSGNISFNVHITAISILGALAQARPDAVSPDLLGKLFRVVTKPASDNTPSQVQSYVARILQPLAQAQPEAVTPDMLQNLVDIVLKPTSSSTSDTRLMATTALQGLAQAKPETVTANMLNALVDIIITPVSDSTAADVRSNAIGALGTLARAKPPAVTVDLLNKLVEFVIMSPMDNVSSDIRANVANVLGELAQAKPDILTSDMLNKLVGFVITPTSDMATSDVRLRGMSTLGMLAEANPNAVPTDALNRLVEFFITPASDSTSSSIRSNMTNSLANFAQAKPDGITTEMLNQLIDSVLTPVSNSTTANIRFYAPNALGVLAKARPEAVTADMFNKLVDAVVESTSANTSSDTSLYALNSLQALAQARPDTVPTDTFNKLFQFAMAPAASNVSTDIRSNAITALGALALATPQSVTADRLNSVVDLILTPMPTSQATIFSIQASAMNGLGALVQARPDAVTAGMLNRLINVAITPTSNTAFAEIRINAVNTLGILAQAKPDVLTTNMLDKLVEFASAPITDSNSSNIHSYAIVAFAKLAQAKPKLVTDEILNRLAEFVKTDSVDVSVRNDVASALTQITLAISETQVKSAVIQVYIQLLHNQRNRAARDTAANALFEFAFREPNEKQIIIQAMKEMQADPKPLIRMTGTQVLEMIAVGDLVEQSKEHPNQLGMIKLKLAYLSALGEYKLQYAASFASQDLGTGHVPVIPIAP